MCRQENLRAKFEKYGNVVEFDIIKNYGFVHFESKDEARAAADALNGTDFDGSTISVEISYSRVRHKPGMGEKGGCYRCGEEGHWSKDCPNLGSRRPRPPRPPPGPHRDSYDDPYYPDPYYRSRYLPPPPPLGYSRYDPYLDPYDRQLLPLPRDPHYRERLAAADPYARCPDPYARLAAADPYAGLPADYSARRSPPPPANGAGKVPYARDPPARDPYAEYLEKKRAHLAAVRSAPYPKPASSVTQTSSSKLSTIVNSRVPGPY